MLHFESTDARRHALDPLISLPVEIGYRNWETPFWSVITYGFAPSEHTYFSTFLSLASLHNAMLASFRLGIGPES